MTSVDAVLLASAINNKMQRGPLHPHLWMKKVLPFFKICWFFWLNCRGRNNSSGVCVNDLSFTSIFRIWLWIRVRLLVFDIGHQWLFWATFVGVVPEDFVEITPFSGVLLCLPVTFLFLCLGLVFRRLFLGFSLSYFGCCGFADLNSHFFWCLILTSYR